MAQNKLSKIYTPKQIEVLQATQQQDWFMLLLDGAQRSGKTILNNDLFLMELIRVRKIADELGISEPMYILGGVTSATIQKNILQELYNKYHLEPKFDKHNNFKLFGVKVVQAYTGTISGVGAVRGMTSFGAYINEASLAKQEVFTEIVSRCSGQGARIITDTNPSHPQHWYKTDYVDKAKENKNFLRFHFELDDNTFLNKRYRDNIKAATPSGMFYDRNIRGLWVSGEGVVYKDFDLSRHYIRMQDVPIGQLRYFVGVDWGYEHLGVMALMAEDRRGNVYVLREFSATHKEIDYWVEIAQEITSEYGLQTPFYCDPARPEHIARLQREGMRAFPAANAVMAGIETVSKFIKANQFFVVEENVDAFKDEVYTYVWHKNKDAPVKENDDVLDAIRYGTYSNFITRGNAVGSTSDRIEQARKIFS